MFTMMSTMMFTIGMILLCISLFYMLENDSDDSDDSDV